MRIFVAGCGFTGARILEQLRVAGHELWGMNRSGGILAGIPVLKGDVLAEGGLEALRELPEMDLLISTLSGTGLLDPEAYRSLYVDGPRRIGRALKWRGPSTCWMLGSTGVYGIEDGGWVTEQTPTEPLHAAGKVQVEAEKAVGSAFERSCILRLSGLYGPGRTRLIRQALRQGPYLKPELWANQIHREDVAGLVAFLAAKLPEPPPVLLVSDRQPARRKEIFDWVRAELKRPEGCYDEDHPQRAGVNRGNKRVDSSLMQSLGYEWTFPTFREGLTPLLRD